jgi:hypothetical protein
MLKFNKKLMSFIQPTVIKPEARKIEMKYATLGDANHYAHKIPVRKVKVTHIEVKLCGKQLKNIKNNSVISL